jgi:hypothetical protein
MPWRRSVAWTLPVLNEGRYAGEFVVSEGISAASAQLNQPTGL